MTNFYNIFDSHAHYDDSWFDDDREELLAALPEKGVCGVVNNAVDLDSAARAIAFAEKYSAFQLRRSEKFAAIEKLHLPNHDARGHMASFLKVELSNLLESIRGSLGEDVYAQVVSVVPDMAWDMLARIA